MTTAVVKRDVKMRLEMRAAAERHLESLHPMSNRGRRFKSAADVPRRLQLSTRDYELVGEMKTSV